MAPANLYKLTYRNFLQVSKNEVILSSVQPHKQLPKYFMAIVLWQPVWIYIYKVLKMGLNIRKSIGFQRIVNFKFGTNFCNRFGHSQATEDSVVKTNDGSIIWSQCHINGLREICILWFLCQNICTLCLYLCLLKLTASVYAGTWSISQSRFLVLSASIGASCSNTPSGSGASTPVTASTPAPTKEERRKSGDDGLNQAQSPRKSAPTIFDAFRPRSKSDASRSKKPTTLIAQMKNAVQVCCCATTQCFEWHQSQLIDYIFSVKSIGKTSSCYYGTKTQSANTHQFWTWVQFLAESRI